MEEERKKDPEYHNVMMYLLRDAAARGVSYRHTGFQGGSTFPSFLYFFDLLLLLFHENALLSLLFHSKMSITRKNTENFPCLLAFYKLTIMFVHGAPR